MRYYFDLIGNGETTNDTVGTERKTFEEARRFAFKLLGEVAAETDFNDDQFRLAVNVHDGSGTQLYRASLTIDGMVENSPRGADCRAGS